MGKKKKKLKPDIIDINKMAAMNFSVLAKFLTNKLTASKAMSFGKC